MKVIAKNVAGRVMVLMLLAGSMLAVPAVAMAGQPEAAAAAAEAAPPAHGGEANLRLPDLSLVDFSGVNGRTLLMAGLLVCGLGLLFGLLTFKQLRDLPVHPAMREVSELIYATCQTYLVTQGKFILILEVFIGAIMVFYFGFLLHLEAFRVFVILLFSLIGIAGSYGVAWFGIRVITFANSRAALASLQGKQFPI
jgi:K(+)-stimulated pyrophosphate-energized sodium pump